MKHRSVFIVVILFCLAILASFYKDYKPVNISSLSADSGFDSDFDSDWGSDWDSDWGSTDWDSDYGYSSSTHSSNPSLSLFIFFVFIMILIMTIKNDIRKNDPSDPPIYENEAAIQNAISNIPGFNKEAFYNFVYNNYVEIQNAWMNFDYNKLRELLTDELFNTYKTQLKTLAFKNQVNIMNGFSRDAVALIDYSQSQNEINLKVRMRVRLYDYLATKKGNYLKGHNRKRIVITYDLTYVKSIKNKKNFCPNCGASLKNVASNVCPYCNSVIVSTSHDYLLSKKEAIKQREE